MSKSENFLSPHERNEVLNAIREAEQKTSGEIRLYIEDRCSGTVLDRAAAVFEKLQMNKTMLRNGVLFYLAVENRLFAVIGDAGINNAVNDQFWNTIRSIMQDHFSKNNFAAGLTEGIRFAGNTLSKHFPYQEKDINELPDDIVFGSDTQV